MSADSTRKSNASSDLLNYLDNQLALVMENVKQQDFFTELSSPAGDPSRTLSFMKEVMLEVWSYQKEIDEAVFAAVGRVGKSIPEQQLIRSMISVQVEETGHGLMALQDYIALGGDENYARAREPSPAALVLIGTVRELSFRKDPLCHLGYMYFFERFTTMITDEVAPYLAAKGYDENRLHFMKLHAEEDVRHADMLANVIVESIKTYENAACSIKYGFDCFAQIYPVPLWSCAYNRVVGAEDA